jgi:hypothetical protein
LLSASASPALRNPLTLMADRPVIRALIMSKVHRIMRRIVMSFKNCVMRVVPRYSECCNDNYDLAAGIFSGCFTTYEYVGVLLEYIER